MYNWSVDGARQLSLNAAYQNGSDFRARFVNDSQRQSITPITLLFQSIYRLFGSVRPNLSGFRILRQTRLESFHDFLQFLRHVYCWYRDARKLPQLADEPEGSVCPVTSTGGENEDCGLEITASLNYNKKLESTHAC